MKGLGSVSKLALVLLLANTFHCSKADGFDFHRMANNSRIKLFRRRIYHFLGTLLETNANIGIYKGKECEETIKVMYPIQEDRPALLDNEVEVLKNLNEKLKDGLLKYGIVESILTGKKGEWQSYEYQKQLPGYCYFIVYTYGEPLFPVLRRCVETNDHKMLFWYFSQMARSMHSSEVLGTIFHNNIGPNVFRLTANSTENATVFIENFELGRTVGARSKKQFIYLGKNDFPIGFKPTMHKKAMNGERRDSECQRYSFEQTSYYILRGRLPWQMDAIDYLWNANMTEARDITLKLRDRIDLENYFEITEKYPIYSKILSVIRTNSANYKQMSEEFLIMSNDFKKL